MHLTTNLIFLATALIYSIKKSQVTANYCLSCMWLREIMAGLKSKQYWSVVWNWTGLGVTWTSAGSSSWLLCVCLVASL